MHKRNCCFLLILNAQGQTSVCPDFFEFIIACFGTVVKYRSGRFMLFDSSRIVKTNYVHVKYINLSIFG